MLPTLVTQLTTTYTAVRPFYLCVQQTTDLDLAHPFYLDTRYYEIDARTGNLTLVTTSETSAEGNNYVSHSHGVYNRNAHGQEILLRPSNITWRSLGGSIDLYFFPGSTQQEVTSSYQNGAIGLPAMQQYYTFGFHQCRWGYANWSVIQHVVDNYAKFSIPLETIWYDVELHSPHDCTDIQEDGYRLHESVPRFR